MPGMNQSAGLVRLSSQFVTVVTSTPSCLATCFCSRPKSSLRFRRWSPRVRSSLGWSAESGFCPRKVTPQKGNATVQVERGEEHEWRRELLPGTESRDVCEGAQCETRGTFFCFRESPASPARCSTGSTSTSKCRRSSTARWRSRAGASRARPSGSAWTRRAWYSGSVLGPPHGSCRHPGDCSCPQVSGDRAD